MNRSAEAIDLAREAPFMLAGVRVQPALRLFAEEALEPRVMQVLVALARKPGDVVSRDDLVAQCWDGRVVGEDAIQRAVAKVRRLGEEGAFQIETIPRVGYRLIPATGSEPALTAAQPSAGPVLAVLPFENFSADPELAFFAEAVADEILQTVARAGVLHVIGRAASFRYRGAEKDVAKIAGDLGATHILDGSLRRGGDRLRIRVELIEAASRLAVWQNQYERPARDLLSVQDEIAVAVASALGHKLQRPPPAIDPETYDLFLRSLQTLQLRWVATREDVQTFDAVTTRAPNFAPGWALAAIARLSLRRDRVSRDLRARLHTEAQAAADRALALDPNNEIALFAQAQLEPPCNWAAREAVLRRNMPRAGWQLSYFLASTGRIAESFVVGREAYERYPLDPDAAYNYGEVLSEVGRHDDMFALHEDTLRRWPEKISPLASSIGRALSLGRLDVLDRFTQPERIAELPVNDRQLSRLMFGIRFVRAPTDEAKALILAGMEEAVEIAGAPPMLVIAFAAQHVGVEQTYALLERCTFKHLFTPGGDLEGGLHVLFSIEGRHLRGDVRFVQLCARLALVRYWLDTGVWPDCADELPYDFRAEARKFSDMQPG